MRMLDIQTREGYTAIIDLDKINYIRGVGKNAEDKAEFVIAFNNFTMRVDRETSKKVVSEWADVTVIDELESVEEKVEG